MMNFYGVGNVFLNYLINQCEGRVALNGRHFYLKILYPPPPPFLENHLVYFLWQSSEPLHGWQCLPLYLLFLVYLYVIMVEMLIFLDLHNLTQFYRIKTYVFIIFVAFIMFVSHLHEVSTKVKMYLYALHVQFII